MPFSLDSRGPEVGVGLDLQEQKTGLHGRAHVREDRKGTGLGVSGENPTSPANYSPWTCMPSTFSSLPPSLSTQGLCRGSGGGFIIARVKKTSLFVPVIITFFNGTFQDTAFGGGNVRVALLDGR